ncbi:hypothetical protein BJ508DRAFT_309326 [Ascobolus immersus RN42]|uniref:Uncharacterized protein n=1 Tax=Ascobolus immersus RN42 TaxID=1160509 RepID=A0A3N4HZ64_ASCIM|nr:hypothetical protein BJ508DRAFT_309326 [Ascobolus immersus RN42]
MCQPHTHRFNTRILTPEPDAEHLCSRCKLPIRRPLFIGTQQVDTLVYQHACMSNCGLVICELCAGTVQIPRDPDVEKKEEINRMMEYMSAVQALNEKDSAMEQSDNNAVDKNKSAMHDGKKVMKDSSSFQEKLGKQLLKYECDEEGCQTVICERCMDDMKIVFPTIKLDKGTYGGGTGGRLLKSYMY